MSLLSFLEGANLAGRNIFLFGFRAITMQLVGTGLQTSRGLLAVCPGVTQVLAVVALRKACVSSVELYHDDNMIKAIEFECLLRFYISWHGNKE
jgi:hypothetical protein